MRQACPAETVYSGCLTALLTVMVGLVSACGDAAANPAGDQSNQENAAVGGTQRARGGGGDVNLCGPLVTDVVIGEVTDLVGRWVVDPSSGGRHRRILTRVSFAVDARLVGTAGSSNSLAFDQRGGQVDGVGAIVSHSPGVELGERSLIFLALDGDKSGGATGLILIAAFRLPPPSVLEVLPSESDLREVFVANCGANPAGVYRDAPPKRWVIPPSVVDRNVGSLFEQLLLQGSGGPR